MTLRKLLMILPIAAFTVSPALAQSDAPKPVKTSHHHSKHVHHTKAHTIATPAKTAS